MTIMKRALSFMLSMILFMVWTPAIAEGYADMLAKGDAFLASGDYAEAIASYHLAQRLQPDNVLAFLSEANVRIMLEDYATAASVVDAALELDPVSPDAWHLKCKIDALSNDIAAFEQDVIYANVCDADLTDAYPLIASLYAASGIYEKAVLYFGQAELNSLDKTQQEQYRKSLVCSGKQEEAERLGLQAPSMRNEALDAAFERNHLMLVETDFPEVNADDFEFPDELWEAVKLERLEDPTGSLRACLDRESFTWFSLSPAGNSGILVAEDYIICYYGGKYRVLFPSLTRGVEDVRGNLDRVFRTHFSSLFGEEGITYSPDGRYAAIVNWRKTLGEGRHYFDPIIIDLSTGEMILTATYGNNIFKDKSGAVATATFSSDGRYFYYMLYGSISEYRTALYRYDLQEDKTEFCYSENNFNDLPYLSETGNGAFVILRSTYSGNEPEGITAISCVNGAWVGTESTFDLPTKYWYCDRLMLSANSGYAFMPGRASGLSYYAFQRVRPDEDFTGLNQYHVISKGNNQIQSYRADELISLIDGCQDVSSLPFQWILFAVLSPDGQYVLLNTSDSSEMTRHLFLVRLEDLSMKEVHGIDPYEIPIGSLARSYPPMVEWHTDTLIIGTKDGVRAYRFDLQ